MNHVTTRTRAVRVSKTSFKVWNLYGPIDQALKTSCQADAVKAVPISTEVHGQTVEVVLWINNEAADIFEDELNPRAQMIYHRAELVRQGLAELEDAVDSGVLTTFEDEPIIQGVAILTGPGGQDFPADTIHPQCILAALLGFHGGLPDDEEGGESP
jgi:hypothetical protein